MPDGQNLHDARLGDLSHVEWGPDETVYRLIAEKKIPPLIVVGVDQAGGNRTYGADRDYLDDADTREPAGHDESSLRMVIDPGQGTMKLRRPSTCRKT
jgi:hypothetical protein